MTYRLPAPGRAPDTDQYPLRPVLFLGISGADLPADLAARTVPHLRRQFRIGDHRRHGVHARVGTRQPCRWLAVEAAAASVCCPCWRRSKSATAAFGIVSLSVFEQIGAFIVDWPLAAMAALNLLLVIVPDVADGRDPADSGFTPRSALRPGRRRGRLAVLRQYARGGRGLSGVLHVCCSRSSACTAPSSSPPGSTSRSPLGALTAHAFQSG